MKRIFSIELIGILLIFILIAACQKLKVYPVTPEIKFKSLSIRDSIDIEHPGNSKKLIVLTCHVIDGDGDVGIFNYNGTSGAIYPGFEDLGNTDLFLTLYEKIDGKFVEVPLKIPNNFAIPYIEPQGQDKSIIADVEVTMEIYFAYYTYDTIKYSFYMYDRQFNKSNIAETPEIPADTLGTITAPEFKEE